MKIFQIVSLLIMFFTFSNTLAQSKIDGSANPCPEDFITYRWKNTVHHTNTYLYTWKVVDLTGTQTFFNNSPNSPNQPDFTIKIPNGLFQSAKLIVNIHIGTEHIDGEELIITPKYIGSIANNITYSTDPSPCGVRQVTFSVPPVTGAVSYDWSLPSGWSGTSISNSIVATTNLNGGGEVRVNARMDNCIFYRTASLYVSRPLPQITNFDPSTVTTCSSATVSVTAYDATSYEWSTPTGTFTTPNSSIQVSTTGSVKVRAYSSVCQAWTGWSASKPIWVGPPPTPSGIDNFGDACYEGIYQAQFSNPSEVPLDLQYAWYLDGSLVNPPKNLFKYRFRDSDYHSLQVVVSNACSSTSYSMTINQSCPTFFASPNPAKDKLKIKFDKKVKKKEELPISIRLFNPYQQEVLKVQPQDLFAKYQLVDDEIILDVRHLRRGVYYLVAEYAETHKYQQIILE